MTLQNIISVELLKLAKGSYYKWGLFILLVYIFIGYRAWESYGIISLEEVFIRFLDLESMILGMVFSWLIVVSVEPDFKNSTLIKNILDGYSRKHFFVGKICILIIYTIFFVLVGHFVNVFYGWYTIGSINFIVDIPVPFVLNSFLRLFIWGVIGFFIIFLMKSMKSSMILFYTWVVAEKIFAQLYHEFELSIDIGQFLPMNLLEIILSTSIRVDVFSIILMLSYLSFMLFFSYYLFLKRNLN